MRNRHLVYFLFLSVWFAVPRASEAQWVRMDGPPECSVKALAVDGSRVYALVAGNGLFKSEDEGFHWSPVETGLPPGTELSSLEAARGALLVGTESGLVALSTDGGQSWRRIPIEPPDPSLRHEITGFAISGPDIFIGTRQGLWSVPGGDGGPGSPVPVLPKQSIISVAAIGTDLLANTEYDSMFVLKKLGDGWTAKKLSIDRYKNAKIDRLFQIQRFEVSGTDIFAESLGNIYLSSDRGNTWKKIGADLPNDATVSCLTADGSTLLAGLSYYLFDWRPQSPVAIRLSKKDDQSWTAAPLGLPHTSPRCFRVVGSNLLAGTSTGIWMSRDRGETWQPADSGLPASAAVAGLAAAQNDLFALTGRGLYLSPDRGKTWQRVGSSLPSDANLTCLAAIDSDLFAGNAVSFEKHGQGVYRSSDHGRTWTGVNADPPLNSAVYQIEAIGKALYAVAGHEILVTHDKGATWASRMEGLPDGGFPSCLVASGGRFFACLSAWSGFTPKRKGLFAVLSFLFGGQPLYAVGPPAINWLFVLDERAERWSDTRARFSREVKDLTFVGRDLYVGTFNGLYCCEDYSLSRQFIKLKLKPIRDDNEHKAPDFFGPTDIDVRALQAAGTDLIVGTDKGILLVGKRPEGWVAARMDMPSNVAVKCFEKIGQDLFAGTGGSGVWRLPLSRVSFRWDRARGK